MDKEKSGLFGIVAICISLLAVGLASSNGFDVIPMSGGGSGNGTNFTINITGQPEIPNAVTLRAGTNVTLEQGTNRTITIDSLGSGSGTTYDDSPVLYHNGSRAMTGNLNLNGNNVTNASYFVTYLSSSINFSVNRTYTGVANPLTEFAQSSSPIKFRVTANDLTGGYNFRVNAQGDQSQDDTTKAGWALVMKPNDQFQVWRAIPGTTTIEALIQIDTNATVTLGQSITKVKMLNLTGAGNAYVCVDASGNLFRKANACDAP